MPTSTKMKEEDIVQLLASEWSWEQVLYKIVAAENLNPWDLDLKILSDSFMRYVLKMKELDFKIPAKYVIIASVLLRMKSDDLRIFNYDDGLDEFSSIEELQPRQKIDIPPIQIPHGRIYRKPVMLDDLINALRAVLKTEKKRQKRFHNFDIKLDTVDMSKRAEELYACICKMMKGEKISFSQLVKEWKKENVLKNFIPLIHLDFEGKIRCKQEVPFDEIFIEVNGHGRKARTT
ncbi:MAG: segregation/condensation protein A [Candidatus Aenigmatarchaeota archaeon]